MHKFILSSFVLVLLLSLSACNESAQPDLRNAVVKAFKQDRIALKSMSYDFLVLLETRRFDELDTQLKELQNDYEQGANESAVLESFLVFYTDDQRYSPYFDEWVLFNDGDWTGRLARGIHHVSVAWKKRGSEYRSNTTREQVDNMTHYFELAKKDINAALKKKPTVMVGYKTLLQIANGMGDDEAKQKITGTVLKIAPNTYYLRFQHLYGLQPKWGGSMQQIRKFARAAQKKRQQNPRLYALLGYEYAVKADQAKRRKQYKKAVKLYSKAIDYAPVSNWLRQRAFSLGKLKRYDEQTRDLNALLSISPDSADLLGRRGRAYIYKKHYPSAIADFERALELEPESSFVSNNLGWLYYSQGDMETAANYFDTTLKHKPENVYALAYCGTVAVRLDKLGKAESCLARAVEISPEDATAWRNYGDVLHMQDDLEHLYALAKYLKYADRKNEREMYNKVKKYLADQNYQLPLSGSSTIRSSGK